MIGGIDEAGRGPVLGPLVVAGVACPDPAVLEAIGVKDSKRLSPGKRERMARLLEDHPDVRVAVRVLSAEALDAERKERTLNEIEVAMFQAIGKELAPQRLFVDAADVDAGRFGRRIANALHGVEVVSEHKADDRHAVVAAASIVAKVRRDLEIDHLRRRLERLLPMELGSGYPSDPKTKAFLAAWVERHGDVPEGARRSWKTVGDLLGPKQATLDL